MIIVGNGEDIIKIVTARAEQGMRFISFTGKALADENAKKDPRGRKPLLHRFWSIY